MSVVVYYRTRPFEPSFSDQAFKEQRNAVSLWLTENPVPIVAEFVEQEVDGASRPRLAEAIETCKRTSGQLLIARTESIGSGSLFEPRIESVSVAIAPETIREIGHIIPCPQNALSGLSLYFPDYRGMRTVPVYLCNNADRPMKDLQVIVARISSKIESLPEVGTLTGSEIKKHRLATDASNFSRLPAHYSILIDRYAPLTDGEMITSYAITFIEPIEHERRMTALIGPGKLTAPFIKLY